MQILLGLIAVGWLALLGAPIAIGVGIVAGTVLSWRAGNQLSAKMLSLEAAAGGVVITLGILVVLEGSVSSIRLASGAVFAVCGCIAGWAASRLAFPMNREHKAA
jgi:hypothetical protein